MTDNFYRAFEEQFRGSRELITSRLRIYLPFVQPIQESLSTAHAIDLGCGRGEWLELLAETGFDAQGVDLDDAMLASCRERGLRVHTGDALTSLRDLPDASQAVVSGFHIAEHLPFDSLQELFKEALRVLVPGGILILETPNPENLVVGTSAFYLDPTHQKPIPPQLLGFLSEYAGFKRSKILRMQESPELSQGKVISLFDVLNGASPDYAVVAQKEGSETRFNALHVAFDAEYGLTLETLANQYQERVEARAKQAETRATLAEAHAAQVEARMTDLLQSTSWRVTAPLRLFTSIVRNTARPIVLNPLARLLCQRAARFINRQPRLKRLALRILNRFPSIKSRVLHLVVGFRGTQRARIIRSTDMTPHANQVYNDLKSAIERRKEKGR